MDVGPSNGSRQGPSFGSIEIKPPTALCTIMSSPSKKSEDKCKEWNSCKPLIIFSGSLICIAQLVILKKIRQHRGCLNANIQVLLLSSYSFSFTKTAHTLYIFLKCNTYCCANSENCSDVHGILFTVIMISISSQSFYYFVIIEYSLYIHIHIWQHTHISVLKKQIK